MKVRIPLLLTFVTALVMVLTFFVPHRLGDYVSTELSQWLSIMGGLGLVLGLISLVQRHLRRVLHRQHDWPYSAVTLVGFLGMAIVGVGWGIQEGTPFDWVFKNVYTPLEGTMFSVLAFFVASAAFRTFRARSVEATLLLLAALLVMFGRVPLGEMILKSSPDVAEWIMSGPALGAKRAIILGVSLGAIAMSLRIVLGIERSHLGGDGE